MAKKQIAIVLGGHKGLLGQALMHSLESAGWSAIGTEGATKMDLSTTEAEGQLAKLFDRYEPDVVFNTVAYTKVDDAEDNPTLASLLNRNLPGILARLSHEKKFKLVHYSTDFVFDGKGDKPYCPEDTPNPKTVYGKTKLEGEEVILATAPQDALIIRTAWLFGPGKKNFVTAILDKCRSGESLSVVDDQIGSPTYTVDLATYSIRLVDAGAHGLYHLVNSGQASWFDLAVEAINLSGLECTVNALPSSAWPQKAKRPSFSVLDTSRTIKLIGSPIRPWMQALREYIFREFPSGE